MSVRASQPELNNEKNEERKEVVPENLPTPEIAGFAVI